MITINNAWYIDALPNQVIVEKTDGTLTKFSMTPFRTISESDFTKYNGHHPRKCKGQPIPEYLYKHYGLERNTESLSEVIRIRISPSEKEKIEAIAKNNNRSLSEHIRYIIGML